MSTYVGPTLGRDSAGLVTFVVKELPDENILDLNAASKS